jgi:hypothetical protein
MGALLTYFGVPVEPKAIGNTTRPFFLCASKRWACSVAAHGCLFRIEIPGLTGAPEPNDQLPQSYGFGCTPPGWSHSLQSGWLACAATST